MFNKIYKTSTNNYYDWIIQNHDKYKMNIIFDYLRKLVL